MNEVIACFAYVVMHPNQVKRGFVEAYAPTNLRLMSKTSGLISALSIDAFITEGRNPQARAYTQGTDHLFLQYNKPKLVRISQHSLLLG